MKTYKKVERVINDEVLESVTCDICNARIGKGVFYFDITTGHYEWGNDSCESIESFQACCPECLKRFIDNDFAKMREVYHSAYINVESDIRR